MGPDWQVLGLLKGPLGQRHLAGRLLSHFWRLGRPLGLAVRVKKAIALSSLLKGTRQHTGQYRRSQTSLPTNRQCPTETQNHHTLENQTCCFTRATRTFLT